MYPRFARSVAPFRSLPNLRCASRWGSSSPTPITSKEEITPLVKQFINEIKHHGPMTVAQYMQQCLSHPIHGYYMRKHIFGKHGDFTTNPEISQLFGESVAVWFMATWLSIQSPPRSVQIVELGPGRGTLVADIVRSLASFKQFHGVLKRIILIETSLPLRNTQLLSIVSAYNNTHILHEYRHKNSGLLDRVLLSNNVEILWCENVLDVSQDDYTFLVAHEFLDALPVVQLKKTDQGWREVVVDIDESETSPFHLRFAVMPRVTPNVIAFIEAMDKHKFSHEGYPNHFCVDFSPHSIQSVQHMRELICKCGGCGLIMDYGYANEIPFSLNQSSFRAIRNHLFVPVFTNPGGSDLTADVNFNLIKNAAASSVENSHGDRRPIHCWGPTTQRYFLYQLGIEDRARSIMQRNSMDPSTKLELRASMTRLMSSKHMGTLYKVMAISDGSIWSSPIGLDRSDFLPNN